MTTPDHLAHLPTAARSQALRMLESTRLNDAIDAAHDERRSARNAVHLLNQAIDRTRTEADKLNADSLLFPPSPEADAERARLAEERARLAHEHQYASARSAAADIVHQSLLLERAWRDRPTPRANGSALPATLLMPFNGRVVNAPGYSVTVLHPDPHSSALLWREMHRATVNRSRARSMLTKWSEREQTYVLRDPHGRLYVAAPGVRLELTPTDIAPPYTEGDALRAALAVYGFSAYLGGEGGFTWLSVSLTQEASEEETYAGAHVRVSSGEDADRLVSQHDERWGASVYDEEGAYFDTFDASPVGSTLAEDCAYIAHAIADFARRVSIDPTAPLVVTKD